RPHVQREGLRQDRGSDAGSDGRPVVSIRFHGEDGSDPVLVVFGAGTRFRLRHAGCVSGATDPVSGPGDRSRRGASFEWSEANEAQGEFMHATTRPAEVWPGAGSK